MVCRSVCRSRQLVSPAKTAEAIEMPFASRTRWAQGNTNYILRTALRRILYCIHSTQCSHLATVRINSKSFPWAVRTRNVLSTFSATSDIRYWVTTTYAAAAAWLPTWKKSRLNWKVKISNTADNAGITQSQARDTRYHRMQELSSLCVILFPDTLQPISSWSLWKLSSCDGNVGYC